MTSIVAALLSVAIRVGDLLIAVAAVTVRCILRVLRFAAGVGELLIVPAAVVLWWSATTFGQLPSAWYASFASHPLLLSYDVARTHRM